MNTPTTLDAAQIAVTRGKNLIVSHHPGTGIFNATMNSLLEITHKIVMVDSSHLIDPWDLQILDEGAEILVFSDFEKADPFLEKAICSLMQNRSADRVPAMPNLKSVVVLMTVLDNPDEIDTTVQELAQLAPSVVVRVAD